jgi:hypothetical protein
VLKCFKAKDIQDSDEDLRGRGLSGQRDVDRSDEPIEETSVELLRQSISGVDCLRRSVGTGDDASRANVATREASSRLRFVESQEDSDGI